MYKNTCIKCGIEFDTKNPKRVICPGCLYPDRKDISLQSYSKDLNQPADQTNEGADKGFNQKSPGYYVARDTQEQRQPGPPGQQQGGFRRPRPMPPRQGGYNQQQGGYNQQGGAPRQGGFNRPNNYNQAPRQGGFNRPNNYNQAPRQGGYNRPGGAPRQGGFNRPQYPQRRPAAANRKLLVSREQVAEIETLYQAMLPLPNPDCHEVIGEKIELEANKVFFGINLIRQKLRLPKLPYPKRKLAVSAEQLIAIQNLYTPLLPLPPIGCHKIISKQLKIDEWRVHVGIGIIRKQLSLPRWNTEREDAPEEFKNQPVEEVKPVEEKKPAKAKKTAKAKKVTKEKEEAKAEESEPIKTEEEDS